MKKLLLTYVFVIVCFSAFAQNNILEKGYSAFADFGYVFNANNENCERIIISTTHGYQFNSHFFVGAGGQIDFLLNKPYAYKSIALPIFVEGKYNFSLKKWSPFIDVRFGYSVLGNTGHYIVPSIGIQYIIKHNTLITLSFGGEFQRYNYNDGESSYDLNNGPFVRIGIGL